MSRPFAAESVFHAISHPIRRRMLELLREQERDVQQLSEHFEATLSTVSQHLQVLRQVGLVSQRRAKQRRIYSLNPRGLTMISEWLRPFEHLPAAGRPLKSKN